MAKGHKKFICVAIGYGSARVMSWSAGLNYILFLIMQSRNFISHLHLVQIAHDFILLKLELGLSDVACT